LEAEMAWVAGYLPRCSVFPHPIPVLPVYHPIVRRSGIEHEHRVASPPYKAAEGVTGWGHRAPWRARSV